MAVACPQLRQQAKCARHMPRKGQTCRVSNVGQGLDCRVMNNRAWIAAKRHQHSVDLLQVKASCHPTYLRMYRSKSHCASGTSIGISIRDNSVDQSVNFICCKGIARIVAELGQGFIRNRSDSTVRIHYQSLAVVSPHLDSPK